MSCLEVVRIEDQRSEGLDGGRLGLDGETSTRAQSLTLADDLLTLLVGFGLELVVGLDTVQEVLVATGTADVLDAYVDTLAELAVSDGFGALERPTCRKHNYFSFGFC